MSGKWFLFFLLMVVAVPASAQRYKTIESVDARVKKRYEKALELGRADQYEQALRELDKVLEEEPAFVDAQIVRAAVYANSGDLAGAEEGYERVVALAPEYEPRVFYELGRVELLLKKYGEAAAHLERLLGEKTTGERLRRLAEEALAEARKGEQQARFAAEARARPVPFEPRNLGPNINTPDYEELPSLTADGRFL
jgi:Tfp pilus assembly protein PilF